MKYNAADSTRVPPIELIEPENIYRPALLIPCPDRSSNFGNGFVSLMRSGMVTANTTEGMRLGEYLIRF